MKKIIYTVLFSTMILFVSCSDEQNIEAPLSNDTKSLFEELITLHNSRLNNGLKSNSKKPQPDIFADCLVFSGIVNPATFKPESDPFDELYVVPGGTFYNGIPLISDSKPGDRDYNGGRWHLNVLKEGVDPAKYAKACSEEDLNISDFVATDMYFSCPMRPRK